MGQLIGLPQKQCRHITCQLSWVSSMLLFLWCIKDFTRPFGGKYSLSQVVTIYCQIHCLWSLLKRNAAITCRHFLLFQPIAITFKCWFLLHKLVSEQSLTIKSKCFCFRFQFRLCTWTCQKQEANSRVLQTSPKLYQTFILQVCLPPMQAIINGDAWFQKDAQPSPLLHHTSNHGWCML